MSRLNPFRCGPNPCEWPCGEVTPPPAECLNCVGGGPGVIPVVWDSAFADVGCDCSQIPVNDSVPWDFWDGGNQCRWERRGEVFDCPAANVGYYTLTVQINYSGLTGNHLWFTTLNLFENPPPDPSPAIVSWYFDNFFYWDPTQEFPCDRQMYLEYRYTTPGGPETICQPPTGITLNPGGDVIDPLATSSAMERPEMRRGKPVIPKGKKKG